MSASWDAKQYQQRHSYVFQYGQAVLDLLAPQKGERILDLGSGSGQLTAAIADAGAVVIGIDSSPEMLAEARANYPSIEFRLADAEDFAVESPVDAVFSNAVLHWVKNAAGAAGCIGRALKPGGRLVAEFGGHGNIQPVVDALREVLGPVDTPWYYPSIGEYATVLELHGLEPRQAWLIDRPTAIEGEDGMEDWLVVFARDFVAHLEPARRKEVFHSVAEKLRPTNYKDAVWTVDYRRLRIVARKKAP
ncbi:MAG: methyltransferase domain-containing protein [Acidobacteriota bacterium]